MNRSNFRSAEGERAVLAIYEHALQRWPMPLERRAVPTRHGETFVLEFGEPSGPPLVLLHGAASNSSVWSGEAATYGARHLVYAIDLPGEAGRSTPNRPAWRGPAFAEWLEDVLDGLGLRAPSIAGLSQGGWAALKLAVALPERVGALALMAPAGVVSDRTGFVMRALVYSRLGRPGTDRIMRMVFAPHPAPPEIVAGAAFTARRFRARVGIVPRFTADELDRVTMPTLLIGGDRDMLRDTHAIRRRLAAHLPRLEAHIVPGAGHALVAVAGDITEFVARHAFTTSARP